FEPPHQLLEHEDAAGDRRVEGGGEPGSGPRGEQHPAVGPAAPEDFADEMAERRGHVHAWPLAAKRKPGTDGERAADELDRNDAKARLGQLAVQDGFDMWNAAADRLGRDPAHEGRRRRGRRGASYDEEPEPPGPLRMRPADKRIAQPVRVFEHDDEESDR